MRLGSEDHRESQKDLEKGTGSEKRLQIGHQENRRLGSKKPEPGRKFTGGALIFQTFLKEVLLHSPHRLPAWFQLGVHLPLGVRSGGSAWASPYNLC